MEVRPLIYTVQETLGNLDLTGRKLAAAALTSVTLASAGSGCEAPGGGEFGQIPDDTEIQATINTLEGQYPALDFTPATAPGSIRANCAEEGVTTTKFPADRVDHDILEATAR